MAAKKTRKKKTLASDEAGVSPITWSFYLLLVIGVFQVYSTSSIYALEVYNDSWFFVKKHSLFAVLAALGFWASGYIPRKVYLILGGGLFAVSLLGLFLTHTGLGVTVGGATRWLNLFGGFRIEPGEFYKLGFGFFVYWILYFQEKHEGFSFWWPYFIGFGLSLALFLKQPDFGSVILLSLSSLTMLFLIIRSIKPFLLIGALAIAGLIVFLFQESYRVERLMTFLNPWSDAQGKGFQTIQSFVAFKKGGFFGEGVGMSQAKYFFLPEAHTDFTLAVFAEEYGFLGVFILLSLFMFLSFQIFKISRSMEEKPKLMYLGYYLSSLFFFCFFINFCVNIGLVPTKGLPLPFLSYGGSSLLSMTILFGFFRSLEADK